MSDTAHACQIAVSLDAPEGLPEIRILLSVTPKTRAEFDAVVEAVGGPCAFTYFGSDTVHAKIGIHTLILEAPGGYRPMTPPPKPEITALQNACKH